MARSRNAFASAMLCALLVSDAFAGPLVRWRNCGSAHHARNTRPSAEAAAAWQERISDWPVKSKIAWQEGQTPIWISNNCNDDVWPAMIPVPGKERLDVQGFHLKAGESKDLSVPDHWNGRVWGRTNCTFNDDGSGPGDNRFGMKACGTGDCRGKLDCDVSGELPVGLVEFNMDSANGVTYMDISLVDGYNVPIAVQTIPQEGTPFADKPMNLFSPSCVASAGFLEGKDWNPYVGDASYLGTTSADPLTFETDVAYNDVLRWCPWDNQKDKPKGPFDGSFSYPDGNVDRPLFNPCLSECAAKGTPEACCTNEYNNPKVCKPSEYSKMAKKVCPDAYSFAYDDQKSTFPVPHGTGFEITFCPAGRSTNIIATQGKEMQAAAQANNQGGNKGKL